VREARMVAPLARPAAAEKGKTSPVEIVIRLTAAPPTSGVAPMKLLPLSPLLALSLVCLGCRDRASEPSRWDKKVEEVKQAGGAATSSQAATAGSALNRYFPPDGAILI